MYFTADDLHLIHECLHAVHHSLSDELEPEMQQHVRKRCTEVALKVQDFVIEAQHQSAEAQGANDQRMADDSPSGGIHRAIQRARGQE